VATPKIKEATVPTPSTVILWFDAPLATNIPVPVNSFTVSYGQYGVSSVNDVITQDTKVR